MDSRTPFGEWLRHRRKLFDLTQQRLADKVGCSSVTIRKLEAGERKPSRQMATLLAQLLEIPEREHEAFVRFARSVDFAESFPITTWKVDHPAWRDNQLPFTRPLNVPLRNAMKLQYDAVSTEQPEYTDVGDGRYLFKAVADGHVRGDLEGVIKFHYTQVIPLKPSHINFSQALPMRVAVTFTIEQGDERLEGYCTGMIYPLLDENGNGKARYQSSGQMISVSVGFVDYFLGRVFLEEEVKMVDGTGTGARGVLRLESGLQ